MIFGLLLFLTPSAALISLLAAVVSWDHLRDRLARGDRQRRIAECSAYGGKLVYEGVSERLRSGAAFAEAMAATLAEIQSLPEVQHSGRTSWS